MYRPFFTVLVTLSVLSTPAYSAIAQNIRQDIANYDLLYYSSGDRKALLETLAGASCLAQTGLAGARDRATMLAVLARYEPLASRMIVPDVTRAHAGTERHAPRPGPEAGRPRDGLEHVSSAASTGAEAADMGLVLEVTGAPARQEARLQRDLFAAQGGATRG